MLPHCQQMKPQRTPETVRVVLEQDQRTNRFDLLNLHHVLTEGVTVFVCTPEDLRLREQQNRCNYCTEIVVTARIYAIVRFTSEGKHNRSDVGRKGFEVSKTTNMTEQVIQQRVNFEKRLYSLVRFLDSELPEDR